MRHNLSAPMLNRTERRGFTVLSLLLSLLVLLHIFAPFSSGVAPVPETGLPAAWQQLRTAQQAPAPPGSCIAAAAPPESPLFHFDPNTLDSSGFRTLGLSAHTTRMLLNWRRKGKIFRKKEELAQVYTLSPETYLRLEPWIRIAPESARLRKDGRPAVPENNSPAGLNTADSAALVRLRGIGPVLAGRILRARQRLGGFVSLSQLRDIYPFPDSTMRYFATRLFIDTTALRRIPLNTADTAALAAHPYISRALARRIIQLRNGLGAYRSKEDLRQVPLMNEEIYRKIVPYLTL